MKKGISINTIVEILSKVINFTLTMIISRAYGPHVLGIVASAQAIGGYIALFGDFGTNNEAIRTIAQDKNKVSKVFTFILMYRTIFFTAVLMVLFFLTYLGYVNNWIIILFVIVTFLTMLSPNSIFMGLSLFQYNGYVNLIASLTSFSLFFLFFIFFDDVIFYPISLLIGYFVSLLVGYSIYFRKIGTIERVNLNEFIRFLKTSLILGITITFARIYYDFDIIMLNMLTNNATVGLYASSFKVIQILWFLPQLYVMYALPYTSKLVKEDIDKLRSYVTKACSYVFVIIYPIFLIAFLYSGDVLLLLFGEEYKAAERVLSVLLIGFVFMSTKTIFGNLLIALKEEKILVRLSIVASFFNIFFNMILIPYIGALGAAISTLLTEFGLMVLECYFIKKKINFHIPWFTFMKVCLVLIILYVILRSFSIGMWMGLPTIMISYIILLYVMKEKVMEEILQLIKRLFMR
ncbi:flippase [Anoxybacillus kestanbolensis]|uniref:flippase n=1 Tax=Anoxybacillus kestanbolensis TaxID=227476 RepID=UPI003D23EB18